jgi:hypothetical protein
MTNGVLLNYIKSQYSLIERSIYNKEKYNREVAESDLEKLRQQEEFNDVVIFGILVNQATKELAEKFVDLREKLLKEESGVSFMLLR